MRAAFTLGFLLVWFTGALAAQDGSGSAGLTPVGALALAALTPVVAWISSKAYDGLKTVLPLFDKLPALVHQVAAPLFGFVFGWLAGLGMGEVLDIRAIDTAWINGGLNLLLMAGIKRWEKSRAPTDATITLEASRASQPGTTFRT
ncbi:MAG: hypothetical protein H0V56_08895 [Chthoniobacterales bacterium]|nr:hypothetical protein [Chthoniobacterales bacterium]